MGRWKTKLYYGKTSKSNYYLDTFDIKTKNIATFRLTFKIIQFG